MKAPIKVYVVTVRVSETEEAPIFFETKKQLDAAIKEMKELSLDFKVLRSIKYKKGALKYEKK
jgi:hypothetical protein